MPSFESIWPFRKTKTIKENHGSRNNSAASSIKSSTSQAEGEKSQKPGLLRKTWKHCKRPGSTLIARHVAQPVVAKSTIVLLSTSLHNPTPSTIDFSMRVTLTIPLPFPVQLDPMVVRLCRSGNAPYSPFLELKLPACEVTCSVEIEVVGETTNILDMKQFEDFINDVMFNKSVPLGINGSAKTQVHGVKSRVQLDNSVDVTGFNSFPGYAIKSLQILPGAPDGALFEAVLDLPNPSLATIEMGDLTFNLYVGPVLAGEVFISNVIITPGPNVVTARVFIDKKATMSNISTIIQSQRDLVYNGKIGVRASGKSTVRNGEKLTYYENALSKLQLFSLVPITRVLGSTVGGIATSISPGNLSMLLRTTGIIGILEGNGVDVAQITQLQEQPS